MALQIIKQNPSPLGGHGWPTTSCFHILFLNQGSLLHACSWFKLTPPLLDLASNHCYKGNFLIWVFKCFFLVFFCPIAKYAYYHLNSKVWLVMGHSRTIYSFLSLLHGHAIQHFQLWLKLTFFHSTHFSTPVIWILTLSLRWHCLVSGKKQPK